MTSTGDDAVVLAQRYRLVERVGAGSMGAVWRATDDLLGRTVAVKQLLLQPGAPGVDTRGADFEEARQRILREGRLAARLQHPHTIAVFDVVLHDDVPWLVMEYLPSRTLGALLGAQGPLDPLRVAAIGRQIADGLAAAHAAGIVHRDVKPGNVLIGVDGTVKITDFGVSRAADDVQLTRTGLIAGTPAFLAPEVARGQTPTTASDVFALGSTLYTAVEGAPPFGLDDNAYALLYAVGAGDVHPPGQAGPLTATLMRMLRDDPEQRPTAVQARDELASVAAGRVPAGARREPRTRIFAEPRTAAGRPDTRVDLLAPARPAETSQPASARPPVREPRARAGPRLAFGLALVVLLAAMGAVLGAVVLPRLAAQQAAPAVPPASAPATAVPAPAPPPSSSTDLPAGAALEDFVRSYYALLPGDTEQAWALLGGSARNDSRDLPSYRSFYSTISSVRFAEGPTAVDGETVRATLRFEKKDGSTSTERYQFTVVPGADGRLVMDSFSRS